MGCIYLLTNKINGKKYIGQTISSFEKRMKDHKNDVKRKNYPIQLALKKYGWDNFNKEIICEGDFTIDELNEMEVEWIDFYDAFNNGYNLTIGGKNAKLSDETKSRISDGNRGKIRTDDFKEKLRVAHVGKPKSDSHRKNISDSKKGIKNPNYGKRGAAFSFSNIWKLYFEDLSCLVVDSLTEWCMLNSYSRCGVNDVYTGRYKSTGKYGGKFGAIIKVEKLP